MENIDFTNDEHDTIDIELLSSSEIDEKFDWDEAFQNLENDNLEEDIIEENIKPIKSPATCIHQVLKDLYHKEKIKPNKLPKECFTPQLLEKLVQEKSFNMVIVTLFPHSEGYSVGLCTIDGHIFQEARYSYRQDLLLDFIDNGQIPPFFLDNWQKTFPQLFYSGSVIVKVKDSRHNKEPQVRHVLLKPHTQSLINDANLIIMDYNQDQLSTPLSMEDKVSVESTIVNTVQTLCLDPSVQAGIRRFNANYAKNIFNTPQIRDVVHKNSQIYLIPKRRAEELSKKYNRVLSNFIANKKKPQDAIHCEILKPSYERPGPSSILRNETVIINNTSDILDTVDQINDSTNSANDENISVINGTNNITDVETFANKESTISVSNTAIHASNETIVITESPFYVIESMSETNKLKIPANTSLNEVKELTISDNSSLEDATKLRMFAKPSLTEVNKLVISTHEADDMINTADTSLKEINKLTISVTKVLNKTTNYLAITDDPFLNDSKELTISPNQSTIQKSESTVSINQSIINSKDSCESEEELETEARVSETPIKISNPTDNPNENVQEYENIIGSMCAGFELQSSANLNRNVIDELVARYGPKRKSISKPRSNSTSSVESEEELETEARALVPLQKMVVGEFKYGHVLFPCYVRLNKISSEELRRWSVDYPKKSTVNKKINSTSNPSTSIPLLVPLQKSVGEFKYGHVVRPCYVRLNKISSATLKKAMKDDKKSTRGRVNKSVPKGKVDESRLAKRKRTK